MQERQAGEEIKDYDQIINRSMERIKGMRTLIMDLLDLTKIQFEKKEEKFERIHLNQLMQTAIENINPYAIQKDVSINFHSDDDIYMNADPGDIEIVFNNLLSNAVKYNKDNGKVEVTLDQDKKNGYVRISVSDTGIGMNEEEKQKLFNEFFRVKNEKTKHITGSGLGLSITKKVVDLYNGKIDVETVPDKGTTFYVHLPVESENKN